MNRLLRPRATKKLVSLLLTPLLILGSFVGAAPAAAQVRIVPNVAPSGIVGAPAPLATAPGSLSGAPLTGLPSLAPSALVSALPAAASALVAAPAPAAVPVALPSQILAAATKLSPARSASPAGSPVAPAAHPAAASALELIRELARVPARVKEALSGLPLFDGGSSHASALAQGLISPYYTEPTLPAGVTLDRKPRRAPVQDHGFNLRPASAPKTVALDADPKDMAAVEKELRKMVDADPARFGAPGDQLAAVSVQSLPSILPGQAPTIVALFRQEIEGKDLDGTPYRLNVDGGGIGFHLKVLDGKAVVLMQEGSLAAGVTPDVMTPAFSDDQLAALAQKRLQSPPDHQPGASAARAEQAPTRRTPRTQRGKTTPRRRGNRPAPAGRGRTIVAAAPRVDASPDEVSPVRFLTRSITNQLDGTWRAINLYQASDLKGAPIIVAVDIKSGKAFAFSAQDLRTDDLSTVRGAAALQPSRRAPAAPADAPARPSVPRPAQPGAITGTVSGRGTTLTATGDDNGPIGPIPMPLTNVYDKNGKVVAVTDENGHFTIPANGSPEPVQLTIRLESPLVPFTKDVDEAKNGSVEVTVTATPGQPLTVMLNPVSDNLEMAANIVGFAGYLEHHLWMKKLPGINGDSLDRPLAGGINVNSKEQQGNAFYDPANDRVVLMSAAVLTVHDAKGRPVKLSVENTSKQSIDYHEYTHRVVQTYSQRRLTDAQAASPAYRFVKWTVEAIMGSDVNESIADFVSYCMRNSSIIGAGFFGNPPPGRPNYIRSALDKTQYDPKDPDPHNGVTVQAMWALREAFISVLGEEQGKTYAQAMIPLVLLTQPLNPISALYHIMLWDLREDGTSPFAAAVRKIALDNHGIRLPALPVSDGRPSA
jgi:hypothetical protein